MFAIYVLYMVQSIAPEHSVNILNQLHFLCGIIWNKCFQDKKYIKFQIVFDPPDLVKKSVPFFIVRRIFFLKKGAKWFIVER